MGQVKISIMTNFGNGVKRRVKNNIIIVSEHNAPNGWDCIWEHKVIRTMDNNKRVKATEKLFIYNG